MFFSKDYSPKSKNNDQYICLFLKIYMRDFIDDKIDTSEGEHLAYSFYLEIIEEQD